MAKKATPYELVLPHRNPEMSAYQWLYEAVRAEILGGRLRPGARLPATRDLARQYRLARGTIVSAFDLLASEGYVEGSVGSGTYVSRVVPEKLLHVTPWACSEARSAREAAASDLRLRSTGKAICGL
jgi:GntR family transcriptional regulator / MocR family aminotransferase